MGQKQAKNNKKAKISIIDNKKEIKNNNTDHLLIVSNHKRICDLNELKKDINFLFIGNEDEKRKYYLEIINKNESNNEIELIEKIVLKKLGLILKNDINLKEQRGKFKTEFYKHLDINRDLTTSEIIEKYKNKIEITLNDYLRKENEISNINMHLAQKTAPYHLRFFNFPTPLLPYDTLFVDIWNNLIIKWREEALFAFKKRLIEQKKNLEKDLNEIKDLLKVYIKDIDQFIQICKINEEKSLRNEFERSNKIVLNAKINPNKKEAKYKVQSKQNLISNSYEKVHKKKDFIKNDSSNLSMAGNEQLNNISKHTQQIKMRFTNPASISDAKQENNFYFSSKNKSQQ
jgi:hypothetical protein